MSILSEILDNAVQEAIQAANCLNRPDALQFIEKVALALTDTFQRGNKVILAGNGGSLCDASHFAEELTGFFREKRRALPALVLNDPGYITCTSNDLGFNFIFSRGIEAYGQSGDLFIGLSTSGNSLNMVYAFEEAKKRGLTSVAFLGKEGGKLKGVADMEWIVEGFTYSDRIQEAHMAAIHIIIECVESLLFPSNKHTTSLMPVKML